LKRCILFIPFIFLSIFIYSQSDRINQLRFDLNTRIDDSLKVVLLIDLANECRYYYPEETKRYFNQALTIAKENRYEIGSGKALKGLGNYFLDLGIYDSAQYYFDESEKIFSRLGFKKELSEIMGGNCYICIARGEYNQALESGHKSLELAMESDKPKEIVNSYRFIGYVYLLIGNFESAETYLEQGIEIARNNNYKRAEADLLSELAKLSEANNENEKAVEYFEKSYNLFRSIGDERSMVYANFYKGESYRCKNQNNEAIIHYNEAYKISRNLNDHILRMQLVISFGKAYLSIAKQGKSAYRASLLVEDMGYNSIEDLLVRYCAELENSSNKKDLLECYKLLAELSKIKGQFKKAYTYYNSYIDLLTEINNTNKAAVLAEMLNRFEEEEQDRQLELLNAQATANAEKISLQRRQQIIILIFAVLLIIVGFGLRNRIRVIRRIKAKLEEINKQLSEEKKRAEKGERFKEKFLTNVSHEIRTPMNAIMGITNLLIKKNHYKEQEKYLEAMSISARHLLGLINAILDLSKLEAGKVKPEEDLFTPQEICDAIQDELIPLCDKKGLKFTITLDEKIPEFVRGDAKMLQKILFPLCKNGVEFSEKGGVYLTCKLNGITDNIAIIAFTVKDTGIGINRDLHEKIFNEVIGEVNFDKKEIESSGLELVLIKQMVELQGGMISVDSMPEKGTTFFIEIPYSIGKNSDTESIEHISEESNHKVKDLSILLVEDNEFNVMVAQEELVGAIENVNVDVAANGSIAIEKVKKNNYDIILMDVQMPVMNGYDATKEIRKMPGQKGKVPIIAMTANIMKTEIDNCFKAGMDGYVPKPFDTEMLISEVSKNLNKPVGQE